MKIIRNKNDILKEVNSIKLEKQNKIALVPTMGNLHSGHIKLVEEAGRFASHVIVSIFVNKKQFGESEDFNSYPRTEVQDLEKLKDKGVFAVYIPKDEKEIFGEHFNLNLDIPSLTQCLCGVFRPNFFGGILAVVCKLFLQIQPNYAMFGRKDYQQLLVVSALAKSLDTGVEVIGCETVREEGGLAVSSRNNYLQTKDRKHLNIIFSLLSKLKLNILSGANIKDAISSIKQEFIDNGFEKIDYLEVRNAKNLNLESKLKQETKYVLFFAGFYKGVRLIDNLELTLR